VTSNPFAGLGLASALLAGSERMVTQIRLSNYAGIYVDFEHIVELAGPGWRLTREEVISDMETTGRRYYVNNNVFAPRAYLEIMPAKSLIGCRYVRTIPDGIQANNLLSLPRF